MSGRPRREPSSLPVPQASQEVPPSSGDAQLQRCFCGALFPMSRHRHCCSVCAGSNGAMHGRRCERLQRALLRNGLAPRRRDRVCSSPTCNRMAGNGYHTCCSYCKYGRHSSRCNMESSGHGQSAGGSDGMPNEAGHGEPSLGLVAPWTPHLGFQSAVTVLTPPEESSSEGRGDCIVQVATVQQMSSSLCTSDSTAPEALALRDVPTASSDEVLEIRLGSDFLQTLD